MAILKQILAIICSPLVLFSGVIGYRGALKENPEEYKNVILLVGDGMGENHLKAALAEDAKNLVMDDMPVRGQSKTNSWPGFILTDSAAGASALAAGIRNIVGEISVYPLDFLQWFATPATLAELAVKKGRLSGVVTTDSTSGATPAAFSAHTYSRNNEADISKDQLASDITLIWGSGSKSITKEKAEAKGFEFVATKKEMLRLDEGERSIGQFSGLDQAKPSDENPSLTDMTKAAINLLDDDPDGFFLMVEAAHIDKNSHRGDLDKAIEHVRALDNAVKYALNYAKKNPSTLVLVTADHETGGVKLKDGKYVTTSGGHTNANVPVFVNVTNAGFANGGKWKNREIGTQLGRVLGFDADVFPTPILPRLGK